MALDLNVSPYFDDFDPAKGFNRILYKPGMAVQARELTQSQSILQDQIGQFADWVFTAGAIISGCEHPVSNVPYIKLEGATEIENISQYKGDIIVGADTGIRARIVDVVAGGSSDISNPNLNTFYLDYITMGGDKNFQFSTATQGLDESLNHFFRGEKLNVEQYKWDGTESANFNVGFKVSGFADESYYGHASRMTMAPGVIYARGHFIRTDTISTLLSRYGTGTTKRVIGWHVQESVVTSAEDNTLLDPASGTYNYNAPGADRLKFKVTLEAYDENSPDIPEEFYNFATLSEDNVVEYFDPRVDDLNKLRETMARRTYDNSGNFVVHGLNVSVQEHLNRDGNNGRYPAATDSRYRSGNIAGDAELMSVIVEPGKAYVQGQEIERTVPYVEHISKVPTRLTDSDVDLTLSVGNYIVGHSLQGDMLAPALEASVDQTFGLVYLRKQGTGAMNGDVIGTARLKHIRFDSSTSGPGGFGVLSSGVVGGQGSDPNVFYRFYLYDVKLSGTIGDVRSITLENSTTVGAIINGPFTHEQNFSATYDSASNLVELTFTDGTYPVYHGLRPGNQITVSGVTPSEYNGTFRVASVGYDTLRYTPDTVPSSNTGSTATPIVATSISGSTEYYIVSTGTTDFTLIGASDSNPGTIFTASGPGLGTGTVVPTPVATVFSISGSKAKIVEPKYAKSVWKTPNSYLDFCGDLGNNTNQVDIEYQVKATASVNGSTGTASFTVPNSEQFETSYSDDQIKSDLILINSGATFTVDVEDSGGSTATYGYATNEIIDLTNDAVTITSTGSTIDITFTTSGSPTPSGNLILYANARKANATPVIKTLQRSSVALIDVYTHINGANSTTTTARGPFSLGVADAFKIKRIFAYRDADPASPGTILTTNKVDVKDEFIFDNGQRDSIYKHSTITQKEQSAFSFSETGYRYLAVEFDHFTHGTTDYSFFTFNSYPDDTVLPVQEIPMYTTNDGQILSLRDAVDFRPVVDSVANAYTSLSTSIEAAAQAQLTAGYENPAYAENYNTATKKITFPVPDSVMTSDYRWNVSKAVTVYMNEFGSIKIIENQGSLSRAVPLAPPKTITLGSFFMSPYPSLTPDAAEAYNRPDLATKVRGVDNRGYKMRDLRAIDKRLRQLEYYVSLNSLEKDAQAMVIPDVAGNDRFKNGILVDNFNSDTVQRKTTPENKAVIVPLPDNLCQPAGFSEEVVVDFNGTADPLNTVEPWAQGRAQTGVIAAPYTTAPWTMNYWKSKTRNLVGELLFDYVGHMTLSPNCDNFMVKRQSNNNLPIRDSDPRNAELDTIPADVRDDAIAAAENGETYTVWGEEWEDFGTSWETTETLPSSVTGAPYGQDGMFHNGRWYRDRTDTQTTTYQPQIKRGEVFDITLFEDRDTVTTVDIKEAKYMREKTIVVHAKHMKPDTQIHAYFDGIKVNDDMTYVYPNYGTLTGSGNNKILKTAPVRTGTHASKAGMWKGQFTVNRGMAAINGDPDQNLGNSFFKVGTRNFKFTDDPLNRDEFATTYCEAPYQSTGYVDRSSRQEYITEYAVVVQAPTFDFQIEEDPGEVVTTFSRPYDPIAQTFTIKQKNRPEEEQVGIMCTGIDVWFRTKSSDPASAVMCELRSCRNGYPSNEVLAYAELNSADIRITHENPSTGDYDLDSFGQTAHGGTPSNSRARNGSTTGGKTTFTFEKPAYLKPKTEYCFVLKPTQNDPNYEVWVSELGEFDYGSTYRISEQGNEGVFFTSSDNSTWTAHQAEDIMFELRRAVFTPGTYTANFPISNSDYLKLENVTTNDPRGTFWDNHSTFPPFPRKTVINEITDVNPFDGTPTGGEIYSLSIDVSETVPGTPGTGYASTDTLTIDSASCSGSGATFQLIVDDIAKTPGAGNVIFVKCTDPGSDYVSDFNSATLTYTGSGTGLTFTPRFNEAVPLVTKAKPGKQNGLAASYGIFDVTAGYFTQNRIKVNSIVGNFIEGEIIQGETVASGGSNATAILTNKDAGDYFRIANVSTNWVLGETITGQKSGATAVIDPTFVEYTDILKNYVDSTDLTLQYSRTAEIANIGDRPYHEIYYKVNTDERYLLPEGTDLTFAVVPTTINASTPGTEEYTWPLNQLWPFKDNKKHVYSYSNRVRKGSTGGWNTTPDLSFRAYFHVNNEFTTPIIDMQTFEPLLVEHRFNDEYTNETDPLGGAAKAKYVSKIVTLLEGNDAEDLQVYLTAGDPLGTSIKAYGKFLAADDFTRFDDANWLELELVEGNQNQTPEGQEREYRYDMPRVTFTGTDTQEGYDEDPEIRGYRKTIGTISSLGAVTKDPGATAVVDAVDIEITFTGGSGQGARALIDTDSSGDPTNIRILDGGLGYSTTDSVTVDAAGTFAGYFVFPSPTIELIDYRSFLKFEVKFVMLAPEDGIKYPVLYDYRAIALQT